MQADTIEPAPTLPNPMVTLPNTNAERSARLDRGVRLLVALATSRRCRQLLSEGCGDPEPRNWNLQTDLSNNAADEGEGGSPLRLVDRLRNAKGEAEFTKLLPQVTYFAIERSQSSLMISQVMAGRHEGRRRGGRWRDIRRDVADANCPTSKRVDLSVLPAFSFQNH